MMAELIQAGLDMRSAIISNVAMDMDKLESVLLHLDFGGQTTGLGQTAAEIDALQRDKFVVL